MNQRFYWLVLARFLFVFAVETQAVLMGWQIYEMTHDVLDLGLIGLAEAIPALSLALVSGLLVDRFNAFRIYQLMLGVSFISILISWHSETAQGLYLAAMITGIARSFTGPAMNTFIPKIIVRESYKAGSAYTTMAFKMGRVIGPGIAGILLGIQGYTLPYLLAISTLILGSFSLLMIRYQHVPNEKVATRETKETVTQELLGGLKFVFHHPLLLSALSLDMFAVLFGGVLALLPDFADEILHVGPRGLGWLRAAPAIGSIAMSIFLIRNPISRNAGKKLLVSVLGFGVCMLVFALSKSFWLSMVILTLSGALDGVSMVIRGAIVQLCSPDEMRGRVAAVNAIFIGSSNELGAFESGLAAKLMGTVPSVIFGGAMTIVTVIFVFFKSKTLRNFDLDSIEKIQV